MLSNFPSIGPTGKGKTKDKKDTGGKQTTLFGLPMGAPTEKKPAGKKKKGSESQTQDSQTTVIDSQQTEPDSQDTDVVMVASTQPIEEESQVPTEVDSQEREGSEEPIEWPDSPVSRTAALVEAS